MKQPDSPSFSIRWNTTWEVCKMYKWKSKLWQGWGMEVDHHWRQWSTVVGQGGKIRDKAGWGFTSWSRILQSEVPPLLSPSHSEFFLKIIPHSYLTVLKVQKEATGKNFFEIPFLNGNFELSDSLLKSSSFTLFFFLPPSFFFFSWSGK